MILEKKYAYVSWVPVIIQVLSVVVLTLTMTDEKMLALNLVLLSGLNVMLYAMMLFFREKRYPYSDSSQYQTVNLGPFQFLKKELLFVVTRYQYLIINVLALVSLGLIGSNYSKLAFWVFGISFVALNVMWVFFSCLLKLKRGVKATNNFLTGLLFVSVFQIQMTTFFESPSLIHVNPTSSALWLFFFGDGAVVLFSCLVVLVSVLIASMLAWRSDLRYWEQ